MRAQGLEAAEQHARSLRGSSTAVTRSPRVSVHPRELCRSVTMPECRVMRRSVVVVVQITWLPQSILWTSSAIMQCKKNGHLARVCRSNKAGGGHKGNRGSGTRAHRLSTVDTREEHLALFCLGPKHPDPIVVNVDVEGVPVSMEVDTSAAVLVMSLQQLQELLPDAQLQPSCIHTQLSKRR